MAIKIVLNTEIHTMKACFFKKKSLCTLLVDPQIDYRAHESRCRVKYNGITENPPIWIKVTTVFRFFFPNLLSYSTFTLKNLINVRIAISSHQVKTKSLTMRCSRKIKFKFDNLYRYFKGQFDFHSGTPASCVSVLNYCFTVLKQSAKRINYQSTH